MEEKIYQPPKANIKVKEASSGSLLKGVIFGSATDIFGSLFFGVIFSIGYAFFLASQGLSENELIAQIEHIDLLSPAGLFGVLIGALISFYAGYLCAKKSGEHALKATLIVTLISCLFGLALGFNHYSIIESSVLSVITALAIFGGSTLWRP
ncbi:MAG: hypothetical protein RKO66_10025 [Candidatus Contendobacter sp.]|nr:hypothetical protein [Candidatus Contendobacter sp.]MDS4058992.1 hypothetical protein [Candidatus Contendobacter sp.]